MADPIFGSKYGPQNGVQNWITFSFLLLGLCLGPVLGSRFGPKSGVSHQRILLLPAEVLQADLRRTSMRVSVNTCFFSLCVPLCFLYRMGLRRGISTWNWPKFQNPQQENQKSNGQMVAESSLIVECPSTLHCQPIPCSKQHFFCESVGGSTVLSLARTSRGSLVSDTTTPCSSQRGSPYT